MTAPLTPSPHHQSAHDPWPVRPAHPDGAVPAVPYGEDGPGMKTEVRQAAVITVALVVSGVLLGLLWLWLAPHVPLVADGRAVYLKDSEGEQAVGVDGTFTLIAAGFGLVSALVVFLVRRRGGVPLVVALAVGALLGAVVAWRLGVWLGPEQDVAAHARQVGKGVTFDAPLELKAKGALLTWPVVALLVHLGLTALFAPRDPEPAFPFGPGAPYPPQGAPCPPQGTEGPYPARGEGGAYPPEGGPYPQQGATGPYPPEGPTGPQPPES